MASYIIGLAIALWLWFAVPWLRKQNKLRLGIAIPLIFATLFLGIGIPAAITGEQPAASLAFSAVAATVVSLLSLTLFLILNRVVGPEDDKYTPW